MVKRATLAVPLAVTAAVAVVAVCIAWGGDGSARAQGEAIEMGIDPEVTGNTATTLGALEDCVRVDMPSPVFDGVSDYDVDVYVRGDAQAPIAYDASVTYDASKVHIAAPGTSSIIKMPGTGGAGDSVPDSDGLFVAGSLYLSGGPGTPGDGTLVRLGLDIGAPGVVTFDFDPAPATTAYASASGEHPITRRTAQLAINEDCPLAPVAPSPTPLAEATPTATPRSLAGEQPEMGSAPTFAQGEPIEMGIDPEVTGNTASTLGALEDCVRVDIPSPSFDGVSDYDIDVYVRGDTQAPIAYDASVTYDPSKVHIATPDTNALIKLPEAIGFIDALPDTDGRFVAGAIYLDGRSGAAGDGTLVRLGLDIGGSGVVMFGFESHPATTAYASASGEENIIHPITRRTAQLAINEDCPLAGVAPSPTPVAEAAPSVTPPSSAEAQPEIGSAPSFAQGDPIEMGIDPEVTGNTASTLGALEDCVRVDIPSPVFDGVSDYDIDVYVRGDTQAPIAYDASVIYDASKVHIAAPGTNALIKLPEAIGFVDAMPDMDGTFVAGAIYLDGRSGAAGDGALVRLGLDIGASGVVAFDFDPYPATTAYVSASGEENIIHSISRRTATLAINEDCPTGEGGDGEQATPAVQVSPGAW